MSYYMTPDVKAAIGATAKGCHNRALFISKFPDISCDGADKEAKKRTVVEFVNIPPDTHALKARDFFLSLLKASGRPCTTILSRLQSRMIINQAGGVVENAGLSIDPHLGLPFIPGSSLKGIARAAARESNAEPSKIMAVFGWSAGDIQLPAKIRQKSYAGSVAFLPAYPRNDAPLAIDILTCHYPEYYRNAEKVTALDNEDPLPSFFPAIEAGAIFAFSLVLISSSPRLQAVFDALNLPPDFDPLKQASVWLDYGLNELGIGAKTSAGYGWFIRDIETEREEIEKERILVEAEQEKERRSSEEIAARLAEETRIAAMSPMDRCREMLGGYTDEQFATFARMIAEKSRDEQRAFMELLSKGKRDRWKVWKKRKPELAETIKKIADVIGEVLP
jgi:CRISPR-associated protein Cmr6